MRNSSLVECGGADNVPGLSRPPKLRTAWGPPCEGGSAQAVVGERSCQRRSQLERAGGAAGSANAGMSSVKADEKSAHRNPEGSSGRVIRGGLGGPKPRPQGVGDGQPVSIPAPPPCGEASADPVGQPTRADWTWHVPTLRAPCEQRGWAERRLRSRQRGGPRWARKGVGGAWRRPYRKPTLVGWCECTKVGESTFVKELGKLTP